MGLRTVALTGGTQEPQVGLATVCDMTLTVPSDSTPHIQETHLWLEHIVCEIVEQQMFSST